MAKRPKKPPKWKYDAGENPSKKRFTFNCLSNIYLRLLTQHTKINLLKYINRNYFFRECEMTIRPIQ